MTDIPRDADGLYTKEYCDAKLKESFDRSRLLIEEVVKQNAILKAKVKGTLRPAHQRKKELKEMYWREEYIVRENLLRRGIW
jgi:hypothetical protein